MRSRSCRTGVNSLRDAERAVVLVTHYQRLLDYIVPDQVHVLSGGRILEVRGPHRWRWNWNGAATTGCWRVAVA